jgi:hypothetical protein
VVLGLQEAKHPPAVIGQILVALRPAGPEKRNILERADGLASADGLEVLAQVGLELGGAYGGHDSMVVRHVYDVNHPPSAVARPNTSSLADHERGTTRANVRARVGDLDHDAPAARSELESAAAWEGRR